MLFFSNMKKRMFSILWWWYMVLTALCAVEFDLFNAAAAPKSSTSKRNDNFKSIQSDKSNLFRSSDKSQQTGDGDNGSITKGGGDIIPIPDHLLNTDYEHQYSYEDENIDGYDEYEDQYHLNTGKHQCNFWLIHKPKRYLL